MTSQASQNAISGPYVDPDKAREKREANKDASWEESFGVGVGAVIDEESFVSRDLQYEDSGLARVLNVDTPLRERNDKIREMGDDPEERAFRQILNKHTIVNPYAADEVNWRAVADEAKLKGYDIQTDAEVLQNVSDELKSRREYAQSVRDRMGVGAKVAEFAGMLTGSVVDIVATLPVYAAAGPIGGFSKTLQSLSTTAKVVGKAALFEGGVQAALEPRIHGWKEDIGSTYTWKDSVANVTATAAFTGTIGMAAHGVGRMIDALPRAKRMKAEEKRRASAELYQWKQQLDYAPDQEVSFADHLTRVGLEMDYQNSIKTGNFKHAPMPDEDVEIRVTSTPDEIKAQAEPKAEPKAKDDLDDMTKPQLVDWMMKQDGVDATKSSFRKTKKADLLVQAKAISEADKAAAPAPRSVNIGESTTPNKNKFIQRYEVKNEKGENIGIVDMGIHEDLIQLHPDLTQKGYGQVLYNHVLDKYPGKKIESQPSDELTPDALNMWDRMLNKGQATKKVTGEYEGEDIFTYTLAREPEAPAAAPKPEPEVKMVVDREAIDELKEEHTAELREAAMYREAGQSDEANFHRENAKDLTEQIKMMEKGTPVQMKEGLADELPEGIDMDDVVVVGKDDDGNLITESFVESIAADDAKIDMLEQMSGCILDG